MKKNNLMMFVAFGLMATTTFGQGYGGNILIPASTFSVNMNFSGGCNYLNYLRNVPYNESFGQNAPYEAIDFSMNCPTNVPTNVFFSFTGLSEAGNLFKMTNGNLQTIPGLTSSFGGNTNTFSYPITDNGPLDENPAVGIIVDPVVFISSIATTNTSSGGGGGTVFSASSGGGSSNPFATIPSVNLTTGTVGQVLGASTDNNSCANYLSANGRIGTRGANVTKLQNFLNKYENAGLPATGFYGTRTMAAVKAFQAKHGINPQSGLQLRLTTAEANKQYCAYVAQGKGL